MKRIITLFMIIILLLSLFSCNSKSSEEGKTKLSKKNWQDYITFVKIKDNSKVTDNEKYVDYTFSIQTKDDIILEDFSVTVNAIVYYRCDDGDIGEHLEKNIVLNTNELEKSIKFSDNNLINYNGIIVESISYDIIEISGYAINNQKSDSTD